MSAKGEAYDSLSAKSQSKDEKSADIYTLDLSIAGDAKAEEKGVEKPSGSELILKVQDYFFSNDALSFTFESFVDDHSEIVVSFTVGLTLVLRLLPVSMM
jgi:hypothetical protein